MEGETNGKGGWICRKEAHHGQFMKRTRMLDFVLCEKVSLQFLWMRFCAAWVAKRSLWPFSRVWTGVRILVGEKMRCYYRIQEFLVLTPDMTEETWKRN